MEQQENPFWYPENKPFYAAELEERNENPSVTLTEYFERSIQCLDNIESVSWVLIIRRSGCLRSCCIFLMKKVQSQSRSLTALRKRQRLSLINI